MSYTWTRECYGLPNEYFDLGIPTSATGDLHLWAHCPGGGFGLRDGRVVYDPNWAGLRPIPRELYDATNPNGFYEKYAMAVITVASTSTQQFSSIDVANWSATAGTYTIDDLVKYSNVVYRCRGTHVAAADNNPTNPAAPGGGGTAGIRLWQPIALNDASLPQIPNRGEMDPGFGAEGGLGVLRFVSYIKRNAKRLGLTGKVIIHGSSAGATNVAQAVALGSLDWDEGSPTLTTPPQDSTPEGAMLDDTFLNFKKFCTVENSTQGQLQAFLASVVGDPDVQPFAGWSDYDDDLKDMIDPIEMAKITQLSVPMYVSAPLTSRGDKSEDLVYNGADGVSPPDVHHASMGWDFFSVYNRDDSVFLEKDPNADFSYNRVTTAGTTQVTYAEVPGDTAATLLNSKKALALDYLTWMDGIFTGS